MKYLFLGFDELGLAIAEAVLQADPATQIHVHTQQSESLPLATPSMTHSFGDVLGSKESLNVQNMDPTFEKYTRDYLYDFKNADWYKSSLIYHLIETIKPDVIVDTVNVATHFKSDHLYQLYLKYESGRHCDVTELFLQDPTMILSAFVQSLAKGMQEYSTQRYIKVSTSGCESDVWKSGDPETHRMSISMQNQISASGILNQLLGNLYDSAKSKITLIIQKKVPGTTENEVMKAAGDINKRYRKMMKNLAK